jgi:formylglycine-generating enzyme required for sulfatase activity
MPVLQILAKESNMKPSPRSILPALLLLAALAACAAGQRAAPAPDADTPPAASTPPATQGAEVTLKGVMMTESSCILKPTKDTDKVVVLFAVEGPPDVTAAVDDIVKKYCSGDSVDGDQARRMQEEFEKRLKYYFTPGDLTAQQAKDFRYRNPATAVTGVVTEKDGKKRIAPGKVVRTKLKYPDKMLAADKPLAMPGDKPLTLKVSAQLSLKCILLPPGKIFAGIPFYTAYLYEGASMRYDDHYPKMWTLTKPFYLAEIPVTQEMYEAVMGANPSDQKGPQIMVTRAPTADIRKFCAALSEKNGRTVRLPTLAEREYAARVGTSTPYTNERFVDQLNIAPDGKSLLPVKSKKPNAWGLYDMFSGAWEMTGDKGGNFPRDDATDPFHAGGDGSGWSTGRAGSGHNSHPWASNHEGIGDGTGTGYNLTGFRVAVEATPEEIAAMERAAKK